MSTFHHLRAPSALGELTLVASGNALTGVYFADQTRRPSDIGDHVAQDDFLEHVSAEIDSYLAGHIRSFSIPISLKGNEFSLSVWKLLQDIPYGQTTTYGEIAAQLGNRHLAQRVGQAVGSNPISIVIPCHRVIGADGSLTGYAGGLERKRFLLDLESPDTDRLF